MALAIVALLLAFAPATGLSQTTAPTAKPPAPNEWVQCAAQEGYCSFEGRRLVRFGADTRWVEREFTNGVACTSMAFGNNPAQGATKTCQTLGPAVEPLPRATGIPKGEGTALLRWTPPTETTEGKPLKNLAGYRIRYGVKRDELTEIIQVPDPKATSYVVQGLGKGTWYFTVSAYSTDGYESQISTVVTKTIK